MNAQFISHPDFAGLEPFWVYHKEQDKKQFDHPENLLNKHIIYRKKATLPAFQKAVLKISADDYYKLYINGRYVTEGPAQAWHMHCFYNEVDVTHWLQPGENTFAVLTYYHGYVCNSFVSGDLQQMLWFDLALDGETALVSDESWRCGYHTGYTACGRFGYHIGFAECYDTRCPEMGFEKPDFDESLLGFAALHQNPQWQLNPQKTRQIVLEEMLPEVVEQRPYGLYVALPTEAVGSLTFTAKGQPGDVVVIRCGEELNSDGSVRFDMRCNCRYEEQMILSGGVDVMDHYDYKGFRYAQLHFPEGVTVTDVKMRVRRYPFEQKYFYQTENKTLKSVLDLCVNTIRYGTQEYITDCPTREKGVYLGDLMISGRAQAILSGDTAFLKNAVESFKVTSLVCPGLITTSACSQMQEIADYSLELPALLAWIYSVDGDLEWLRSMYPTALGVYEYFAARQRPDGLLEDITEKWNLVDWPWNLRDDYDYSLTNPLPKGQGMHNVINALWYGCKLAMEELAQILGDSRDFGTAVTRAGFRNAFYNEKVGLFTDTPATEHTAIQSNVLPLLFGLTDSREEKERIYDQLRQKKLTTMGVYMAYFALAGLKKEGQMDLCLELATADTSWPNMLTEGATVTFEAWGKDQKTNCSLFHPWATAPLVIFADHVRVY